MSPPNSDADADSDTDASGLPSLMMDRGSEALKTEMNDLEEIEIRQTRRGWCSELCGCDAKNEFKYYVNDGKQVFESLEEDTSCFCLVCCNSIHHYKAVVKKFDAVDEDEILTIIHPCACEMAACKCCCYQRATFESGGKQIGSIQETCYYCIPTFNIYSPDPDPDPDPDPNATKEADDSGKKLLYTVRPPTCCGGLFIDCCADGNHCAKNPEEPCCDRGCCRASFRFYHVGKPNERIDFNTDCKLGKISTKPKSLATHQFTDANILKVEFPDKAEFPDEAAIASVKGIFIGTAIFLNTIFFQGYNQ